MTSFIKQKTATFSRPRIIVKYMDTLLTSKPLTTATPVDGYAIVDGDIVLFTNLSAINYTIHRATVTGVNITWTQLALGQSADGLPALGDEVFIQAGTYTKKIYWYDGVSFIEFKSGGGIGDSSIFGYLNSQDDNVTTQPFTTGNNATFLTAGTFIGSFNQKNETNPLNGKSSYTYTQGATSINDWIASYPITVPLKAKGVTNVTKLSYMYDGGNSDILPVVYDVTNSKILSSSTKYLENTNGVTKRCELVYDVPSTCSSIKIGFHVKVTNNEKILKFDDIETGVWTPQAVNLVEQESVSYVGANSRDGGNCVKFTTKDTAISDNKNLIQDDNSGTATTYKILKNVKFNGTAGLNTSSAPTSTSWAVNHYSSSGTIRKQYYMAVDAYGRGGTIPFTGTAIAGDYFKLYSGNALNSTNDVNFNITATAISENVVQSYSEDRVGETIYSIQSTPPSGFISAQGSVLGISSGTHQGETYKALYKYAWNIASTTAGQPYYISAAKGASADADWTAGKTITIDESGLFTRAFKSGVTNGVGQKQDDAFQGHYHNIFSASYGQSITINPILTKPFDPATYGSVDTSVRSPVTDGTNGTPRTASETRPVNVAKYVYIRYAQSTPTLLALPTSKQNSYNAVIATDNSITSKDSDWIASITHTDGQYVVVTKNLGLTVAPKISVSAVGTVAFFSTVTTILNGAATITILQRTNQGTYATANTSINLGIDKQSPDYTAPGVFVGNVAKNQVAIIQYRGNGTRTTLSTTPVAMPLNAVKGDSQIVSILNNQFTLQPGDYEIDLQTYSSHADTAGWAYGYLYNVTDSIEVDRTIASTGSSTSDTTMSNMSCKISISSVKVFEFRFISSGTGTHYLGNTNVSPNDLNGFIKITKLNGQ